MIERLKPRDAQVDDQEPAIDMSPAAIDRRLDMVSELYELGRHLAQAKLDRHDSAETSADEVSVEDH